MPKKYHITVAPAPLEAPFVHKFRIVRREVCINCGRCTKVCIYEAHVRRQDDPRKMAEPQTVVCKNCFRCIQECPQGALVKDIEPAFRELGGAYWKPEMQLSLFRQAGDGKVPVSGAGYRGPFTGPGFDGMWTDMSEIVRPTRDGIHGREYISTSVEVGRKLNYLAFDAAGKLAVDIPATVDLPIPLIFDDPTGGMEPHLRAACALAAARLGTAMVVDAGDITPELLALGPHLIPLFAPGDLERRAASIGAARLVEVAWSGGAEKFPAFRERARRLGPALVIARVAAAPGIERLVLELARAGAEAVHVVADGRGRERGVAAGTEPRFIKEIVRSTHRLLVESGIRDELTLVASGGVAMAEHVPKIILCGADLTAIDLPLLIALGARVQEDPEPRALVSAAILEYPAELVVGRIVNLMGAWHSQLLEVMGAMGIREARRLRGETGRAIFFEEIDREVFGRIFGGREVCA